MTTATNRGYQFEVEVNRSLKYLLDYFFKIPDARSLQFLRKGMVGDMFPASPKVPADFVGFKGEHFYLIECKQTKGLSIPFNRLRQHQEIELLKVVSKGGYGLVIVNFNNRKRKKDERIDRTFVIDIIEWIRARDFAFKERESLPLKWIIANGEELRLEHLEKNRVWKANNSGFSKYGFGEEHKEIE